MTRQELIQELMQDSQAYCCYCGTPKVRFSCCGENHFETFAEMNKETQESILSDMAGEVSDFWEGYVPEPVKPAQPVAWEQFYPDMGKPKLAYLPPTESTENAFYTSPPAQRKPLTDEEIDRLWSQSLADTEGETYLPLREFARAIEAKLKEKNT